MCRDNQLVLHGVTPWGEMVPSHRIHIGLTETGRNSLGDGVF